MLPFGISFAFSCDCCRKMGFYPFNEVVDNTFQQLMQHINHHCSVDVSIWMTPCKTTNVMDHHCLLFFANVRGVLSLPGNQLLGVFMRPLWPPGLQVLSFRRRDLTDSAVTPALNTSQKDLFLIICNYPSNYGKTMSIPSICTFYLETVA
jgi:hypothetical protein